MRFISLFLVLYFLDELDVGFLGFGDPGGRFFFLLFEVIIILNFLILSYRLCIIRE